MVRMRATRRAGGGGVRKSLQRRKDIETETFSLPSSAPDTNESLRMRKKNFFSSSSLRMWIPDDVVRMAVTRLNNNLSRLHLFCLLVNDPRSYNHVQGDDLRDSNPTFSCCLARVAIPCQVQQPGTTPPSGSKRSFFPLLFLPLLIEEQR